MLSDLGLRVVIYGLSLGQVSSKNHCRHNLASYPKDPKYLYKEY